MTDIFEDGNRLVKFYHAPDKNIYTILDEIGQMPLPPYITEKLEDKERYQTVYSKEEGSAAAPTAGLHFTPELMKTLQDKGVGIAEVTLHVGLGTFRPVKEENVLEHKMHSEHYYLSAETAARINETKKNGGRVIAVGTTSCRTLESVATFFGEIREAEGWTDIFIYPGYEFKCIDALITNFHLPESTLIMLVSALAGYDHIMNAYRVAVQEKYRFFQLWRRNVYLLRKDLTHVQTDHHAGPRPPRNLYHRSRQNRNACFYERRHFGRDQGRYLLL